MSDMNMIIANNIIAELKKSNKKQIELSEGIGTTKQIVSKMLNGSRMISAVELYKIADYLCVPIESLVKIPKKNAETDIIHAFMGKVESEEAKAALKTADELADMILFHANLRSNSAAMMEKWEM